MLSDNATVTEILPSYYWPRNAVVIVTGCGHRHVRPNQPVVNVGDPFLCPFCVDNGQATATTAVDPSTQLPGTPTPRDA